MKKELAKNYEPKLVEQEIYKRWEESGYFHQEVDKTKEPYCIMMPPPNITGQLHLGHALDNTIQDILIRTKRMEGFNTLWQPGTDHAAISTEMKIVEAMKLEGLSKSDVTRDEFLKRAFEWRDEYGTKIVTQLRRLGTSCDWERERFTMDEGLSDAVLEVFVQLYNKGYIYRGEKIVNWCPHCKTTISDAEVEHEDKEGGFWHFTYKIDGTNETLEFATTRPETILGDTAIAVNPNDERYAKYVGKTVTVPIVNRVIPIIADDYVEADFGTGVVKITPAHDPNDFMVGQRHNLPLITIMNDDATMNENTLHYEGLDRYDARKKIIEEFTAMGQFVGKKDITHAVGTHDRCKQTIEPLVKLQWFVKMEELAKPALEVINDGRLNFHPERFGKTYTHWLNNIQDWCISRQLWWGHRIPAYYCEECGEFTVSKETPKACSHCGHETLRQDEDCLDTWFSSALWPFSTLGWPENTEELEHFYPTNVLVTGYDIIFFWVVRMVFSGMEQMNEVPFKDVFIHGLIRDAQGRKMSKSLGNGIDPLEVVDKYGADVLRFTLITGNAMGADVRFSMERIETNYTFLNKIWNSTKFLLMHLDGVTDIKYDESKLTIADKWILSEVNEVKKYMLDQTNAYELGLAGQKIHDFIWDTYCDWYIEMVKPRLYDKEDDTRDMALWTLKEVLITSLKLLHPFMPFITEEIFTSIQDEEESIMISNYPLYEEKYNYKKEEQQIELIQEAVRAIRDIRTKMNVKPSKKVVLYVLGNDEKTNDTFRNALFAKNLLMSEEIVILENYKEINDEFVSVIISNATIYLKMSELVDFEKEKERLEGELKKLDGEVKRIEGKLSNEGFVAKAPEKVITEEKEKLEKYSQMRQSVIEQLEKLK